ncbi:MAG TPA: hypothetical protein VK631_07660, partial [Solirubrobacteraceae bacterium]|nr:hypothetical protein [Solirubrobacteraceae bacterium]
AAAAVSTRTIAPQAVTTDEVATNAITGAKVRNGTLTAADIGPLVGSVDLAPGPIAPGCTPKPWPVAGVLAGDRVVVNADRDLDPNVFVQPAVQGDADLLVLRICNLSGAPITTIDAATFSFVVIR